ncbi:hypothetical protein GALMADRAFT_208257 [Galerina marginata CBS 339.88]|uniref:Uncharacterized protein n=1 Tax=Galerina marginata (strain CBS 339.88) TaxID=685588 RepID=A0A067TM65_GALM3|nr:hypothetical protein GALMADRAFT_208257 [Galerina marginata CBS 339.88]
MAGVANLFIRMRRLEESTVGKQDHTVISSGEPRTQPGVKEGCNTRDQVSVEWIDNFTCVGGVNVATLLRASRTALLERVFTLGANALLNEQWECTISGPKPVHNGAYKVQVRYLADATHSTAADPHKPVALDQAKGVPGLMTITKRGGY